MRIYYIYRSDFVDEKDFEKQNENLNSSEEKDEKVVAPAEEIQ